MHLDIAAHEVHQLPTDRQPKPGPALHRASLGHLDERLEQARLVRRSDTDTGILHVHPDDRPPLVQAPFLETDRHLSPLGELDRIAHQVGEHLLEAQGIDQHVPSRGIVQLHNEPQAFLPGQAFEHAAHRLHDMAQANPLGREGQVAGLDLGDVEDVADEQLQRPRSLVGDLQRGAFALLRRQALQDQFEDADDRIHRRTDLVAHGRQEDALRPIRLVRLAHRLAQLAGQALPFGDVDPAVHQAEHPALAIPVGRDPMVDLQQLPADAHRHVGEARRSSPSHRQALLVHEPCLAALDPVGIGQQGAAGLLTGHPQAFQVIAVAGQQATVERADAHRVGNPVDQRLLQCQAAAQVGFGTLPAPEPELQDSIPAQASDADQAGHQQAEHQAGRGRRAQPVGSLV